MKYVAIDTETTGLSDKCSLIEIAMVFEDTSKPDPIEELPAFHAVVNVGAGAFWEPFALQMHLDNGLYAQVATEGISMGKAVDDGMSWLSGRFGYYERGSVVAAGKNFAGFDKRFLPFPLSAAFHYRAIDPGSVFMDFNHDRPPGLNDLLSADEQPDVPHRALEDARNVVRVLRRKYA